MKQEIINLCSMIDKNECSAADTNDCSHHCYNTVGSYVCDCNVGYKLDDDGLNCVGELQLIITTL